MTLKLVCISDLHLGAKDSLLSSFDVLGHVAPRAGPVPETFAKALLKTVEAIATEREPVTLVLLGDVLDLGLSQMGVVSRNLLNFLKVLFPSEETEGDLAPFTGGIVYVPGNHDHHVWRMAQDEQYVDDIKKGRKLKPDIQHVTSIVSDPHVNCRLVTELMQRVRALRGAECHVAYPNWAIRDKTGKRAVVLHHGHYLDPTYMALSHLAQWLGLADDPTSATGIEKCNGPWIDFLWSEFGSAGHIRKSADTLYDTMMDGEASHEFAESLSQRITAELSSRAGIRGDAPLLYGLSPGQLISAAVDFTLGRAAQSQRDGYRDVLSREMISGLRWYLTNPLAGQFTHEKLPVPDEVTFIFGHTHKPFQDQIMVPPYETPTKIFNTGGWVLDEPTLMPCQGAAAVLVDDALNVASIRLFNDVTNGRIKRVNAEGVGGHSDVANPLLRSATAAVKANATLWSAFSDNACEAIVSLAHRRVHKRIREMGDQRIQDRAV